MDYSHILNLFYLTTVFGVDFEKRVRNLTNGKLFKKNYFYVQIYDFSL